MEWCIRFTLPPFVAWWKKRHLCSMGKVKRNTPDQGQHTLHHLRCQKKGSSLCWVAMNHGSRGSSLVARCQLMGPEFHTEQLCTATALHLGNVRAWTCPCHTLLMAEDGPNEPPCPTKGSAVKNIVPKIIFLGTCKICAVYDHVITLVSKGALTLLKDMLLSLLPWIGMSVSLF